MVLFLKKLNASYCISITPPDKKCIECNGNLKDQGNVDQELSTLIYIFIILFLDDETLLTVQYACTQNSFVHTCYVYTIPCVQAPYLKPQE